MNKREFYQKLSEEVRQSDTVRVRTFLKGPREGQKEFLSGDMPEDEYGVWTEELKGSTQVVICGGGHISLALEKVLKTLELYLTILDDREEFANRERFTLADEVYCVDFENAFSRMKIGKNVYYIIVTREHENDYLCLKQILQRPYGYVGMIGSKGKVKYIFDRLEQEGFSKEQIDQVHAPIGLPLGGRTPAEIAISITAEMIQVRSRQQAKAFPKEMIRGLLQEKGACVMATIIEAAGSAPRGKGSRMLVASDGRIYGTIGGGAIEGKAIAEALQHMGEPCFLLKEYDLSGSQDSELGMVCGGRVKVMFEYIEPIEE
ncbi:MAG: XdhC family protein [Lachnospiraceae bacterium]|jgi:xanthine dehydrogenase accessory factor